MEIDEFKQEAENQINLNLDLIRPYVNFRPNIFYDFTLTIYEANMCILTDCKVALITLTNHILERLLKVALVYNEIGLNAPSLDSRETYFDAPSKKYLREESNILKSAKNCCTKGLITKQEKKIIENTFKAIRNSYSHGTIEKIVKEEEIQTLYTKTSLKPNEEISFRVNIKNEPVFQSFYSHHFADREAMLYYDFVYNLIANIEKRLIHKFNSDCD